MTKLVAPGHVSVGGKLYECGEDGIVDVPDEHVATLLEAHGCKTLEQAEADAQAKADAEEQARRSAKGKSK